MKRLRIAAGLTITVLFLWLIARQLDGAALLAILQRVSMPFLLVALACLCIDYALRILRWGWMLRALDPAFRLRGAIQPFLSSIALNNVLPLRAGDVIRVVGFSEQLRAPRMRLLATLFIERLLDLLALLTFFFIGLAGVPSDAVPVALLSTATWLTGAAVVAVLLVTFAGARIRALGEMILDAPFIARRTWGRRLRSAVTPLFDALLLLRSPVRAFQLLALSLLAWCFEAGVFLATARALAIDAPPQGALFAMATGTLATLVPSSPGYVGTFDYFTLQGMAAYAIDTNAAGAFAVLVHLVLWLPLTIVGALLLFAPIRQLLQRTGGLPKDANT
jgi:uncharacterized protein (TIRG00374 family)